jgi:hypothetical protein
VVIFQLQFTRRKSKSEHEESWEKFCWFNEKSWFVYFIFLSIWKNQRIFFLFLLNFLSNFHSLSIAWKDIFSNFCHLICVVIFCKLKLMMESILGMDTFLAELEICEELIKDFDLIFSIRWKKIYGGFCTIFWERQSQTLQLFSILI